jgi:hypothetical protein
MKTYTSTHSLMAGSMMQRHGLAAHARFMADDSSVDESLDFSLADLMDMDVSDIEEMRFETIPMGIYTWEVTAAGLSETTNSDDEKRFVAETTYKILEVHQVAKGGVDRESLVGKTQTEKEFINPAADKQKIAEAIGRIRARIADIGCNNEGSLGAIMEGTIGHQFKSKLIHQKDRNDSSKVYARIKPEPAKKKAA